MKDKTIQIMLGIVIVCTLVMVGFEINYNNRIKEVERVLELNFVERGVAGTGSMKPNIDKDKYPEIYTINRKLNQSEKLIIGRIYIYKRDDELIIHRLVGKYDICNTTIYVFKGDRNLVVDSPVNRSQIIEEVQAIRFFED